MAKHYGLKAGDRILDVGCGKGFLLHEFTRAVPGVHVEGIDISDYCDRQRQGRGEALPQGRQRRLAAVSRQVVRFRRLAGNPAQLSDQPALRCRCARSSGVGKGHKKYIMVESWRNERERMNLLYWQLTCESFHDVKNWEWIYKQSGYQGDWGFIFFE
jgi:protein-L-isoaspartate(D-aspartate) O-methyltransferase